MHIDYVVKFLSLRGLDFRVNIRGYFHMYMLVIEVNVEFSMINAFMYKYINILQEFILWVNMLLSKVLLFSH